MTYIIIKNLPNSERQITGNLDYIIIIVIVVGVN
jgi:hypothetical protein